MGAAELINRLETTGRKVKTLGQGDWMVCCPAHGDRTPSLHITELPDSRVLLHCFGGCEPGDVLAAVGMEFRDLFPQRLGDSAPTRKRAPARELVKVVDGAAFQVELIAMRLAAGQPLTDQMRVSLTNAAARITDVRRELTS